MIFIPTSLMLLIYISSQQTVHAGEIIEEKGLIISEYNGTCFPMKYLKEESIRSTATDLVLYVNTLNRTLQYFLRMPNATDPNTALGLYMTKFILKKVVIKYADRLNEQQEKLIKRFENEIDYTLSHFIYSKKNLSKKNILYKVSQLLRGGAAVENTLKNNFKKDRLKPWIFTTNHIHDYVQQMDEATLDRNIYAELSLNFDQYHLNQIQSDDCLTRILHTADPVTMSGKLQRCQPDVFCEELLHTSPSIAYTLSHRLFNLLMRRLFRHCYIQSDSKDLMYMDMLCSFMYREAVYIARRGFFARDLFTEHLAMCSLLGYEEFQKRSWFRKIASWVDERGCVTENFNFQLNLSKLVNSRTEMDDDFEKRTGYIHQIYYKKCQHHPMILAMTAMAGAIRHTLQHMIPDQTNNF